MNYTRRLELVRTYCYRDGDLKHRLEIHRSDDGEYEYEIYAEVGSVSNPITYYRRLPKDTSLEKRRTFTSEAGAFNEGEWRLHALLHLHKFPEQEK